MRLRHRKADGEPFLGCEYFPRCRFVADYDEILQGATQSLRRTIDVQRTHIDRMISKIAALQPPESPSSPSDSLPLKTVLALCHPDKWGDHPIATEMTKQLLALRDQRRRQAS